MSAVRFHSLPASALEERLFQQWKDLHREQEFSSPFTNPQFTRCLAEVRPRDTRISLMEVEDEVVGFFPFQQKGRRQISPLGEFLNDYQAPVIKKGYSWDATEWIKQSSFNWFAYNHLPEQHKLFNRYSPIRTLSPVMEVSGGYDRYLARLKNTKGKIPGSLTRTDKAKRNRLIDEIGEVVFIAESHDNKHLQSLRMLKSQQYRETGAVDIFAVSWVNQILEILFHQRGEDFSGKLSVLMAGDKPVAYHFGLGSGGVWHYWFPAFDPAYACYSVGILLLIEMAKVAADDGFDWIDLGRGDQRYKMELKSGDYGLQEGILSRPQWRGDLVMRKRVKWAAFRQSRLGEFLKSKKKMLFGK